MFRCLTTTLVVTILALSNVVDANTEESLELKMYDHDFQPSHSEMTKMLEKADLEGHGYEKEVTVRLVRESGSNKTRYDRSRYYYKVVPCTQLQKIYQEIYILLPGAFGLDMISKYNKEVKKSNLDNMKYCKAGVEVHFMKADSCYKNGKVSSCRRKRKADDWCVICFGCKGNAVV